MILFSLFSCKNREESPVIARVGNSVLTLDDLYRSIPPEYIDHISREQIINYIKQWIDTELLYQEALRRKIHREQLIRSRLEKMKKDLLSAEMISRNSLPSESIEISEAIIQKYYNDNKSSFIREADVIKYAQILTESAKEAWAIRNRVSPKNFITVAAQHAGVPLDNFEDIPYIPLYEIPPEIRDALIKISENKISLPIKTPFGYHIIYVIDKQDKGSICSLEEVRDEIVDRISTQQQRAEIEQMISELRLKTNVDFYFDRVPALASSMKTDSASSTELPYESMEQ
jgi:parvulin-like peptidyl-prolyl isomerase